MRFILPILLFISIASAAQVDSSVVFSKLEQAIMEPGSSFKTETENFGELNRLAVGIISIKNMENPDQRKKAICFSRISAFMETRFAIENNLIDAGDLEKLIGFIRKTKEVVDAGNPGLQQSYIFTSSNLIVFKLENRINNFKKWDLFIYKRYKNLNIPVAETGLVLNDASLGSFLSLLNGIKLKI